MDILAELSNPHITQNTSAASVNETLIKHV